MRRPNTKVIAGIDLHGNNVVIGIMNQDGKRIEHQKVDADEDGVGGDDAADALRYMVATKSRGVTQRKLRGL